MEKEIFIQINEWNSSQTFLSIPDLNFTKEFRHRIDAENWAKSIFKKPKFHNVEMA